MSWAVFIESSNVRHVIPLDDEKEHADTSYWFANAQLEPSPVYYCPCSPRSEYIPEKETWIFIHSSFDGREGLEWAADILGK